MQQHPTIDLRRTARCAQHKPRPPLTAEEREVCIAYAKRSPLWVLRNRVNALSLGAHERSAIYQAEIDAKVQRKVAAKRPYREPVKRVPCLPLTWRPVADEVAQAHGLSVSDMLQHRRHARVRREFWYRIRDERGASYADIGRRTGGYNHTTVMNAFQMRGDAPEAQND